MQSPAHEHCGQSCRGPPAPKDGAIRMTKRNSAQQFLNGSKIQLTVAYECA